MEIGRNLHRGCVLTAENIYWQWYQVPAGAGGQLFRLNLGLLRHLVSEEM